MLLHSMFDGLCSLDRRLGGCQQGFTLQTAFQELHSRSELLYSSASLHQRNVRAIEGIQPCMRQLLYGGVAGLRHHSAAQLRGGVHTTQGKANVFGHSLLTGRIISHKGYIPNGLG